MRHRSFAKIGLTIFAMIGAWHGGQQMSSIVRQRFPSQETVELPDTRADKTREVPAHGQVMISVRSDNVPGCLEEGAPFSMLVEPRWQDRLATTELSFRWRAVDGEDDSISVSLEGQSSPSLVQVGKALPSIDYNIPIGEVTSTVKLTTFIYERRNDDGEACFKWQHPPTGPTPFDLTEELEEA